MKRIALWSSIAGAIVALASPRAVAQAPVSEPAAPEAEPGKKEPPKADDAEPKPWSVHGQATTVMQGNWPFPSPYAGTNSLLPIRNQRTTETGTLFLGYRIWSGGEVYFNPEVSGGRGLSSTLGLAGFPNGEATRVGAIAPTPYIARLFYRQTMGLGGETEEVADGPNQIAGTRDVSRLTFRIGKMSALDVFDDNAYSHDPRTQFMNWSLMDNGAWDYPANTRGYTYGATLEFNQKSWAIRYGIFAQPAEANGAAFDPQILRANGSIVEVERRYELFDRPGKLRAMAYLNNAHMGNFRVSLRDNPTEPDITSSRAYRVKYGFGLNAEQQLTDDLGGFARIGWSDGHTENWAFTQIDSSISVGLLRKGTLWHRPGDQVGLAFVANGLSTGQRDYLAAGGIGFIIGDGRLNYGPEEILEAYYNWQLKPGVNVTFDVQGVNHPAYNRDRGPVGIAGVRVHLEF